MNKSNRIVLGAVVVAILVALSVRTSYAFLSDISSEVTIDVLKTQNGEMRASYQNNNNMFNLKGINPSDDYVGEKTFSIAATDSNPDTMMVYMVALNIEYNSFENSDIYFIFGGKNNDSGRISD